MPVDRREQGGTAKACWGDAKRDTRQRRQSPRRDEEGPSRMGMEGLSSQAPGAGKEQASQVGIFPFQHGKKPGSGLGINLSSSTWLLTALRAVESCSPDSLRG